ncbi:MAG: hypothetical protein MJ117_00165 [Lachnospiraceae bacterium]|nr:hypothetical protein [Lachnospiraceae bacterium]
MLDRNNLPEGLLDSVKRQLTITWDDEDTNGKLLDMMEDAEQELNHILGAEMDYSAPGMARRLYLNYMLYAWNECLNEFEDAYRKDILRIRHINRVKGARERAEEE